MISARVTGASDSPVRPNGVRTTRWVPPCLMQSGQCEPTAAGVRQYGQLGRPHRVHWRGSTWPWTRQLIDGGGDGGGGGGGGGAPGGGGGGGGSGGTSPDDIRQRRALARPIGRTRWTAGSPAARARAR